MSDTSKMLLFREMEDGVLAGAWTRPVEGFAWRTDLELSGLEGDESESGPWLVPIGDTLQRYPVLSDPTLLDRFVQLGRNPTEAKVLQFARRFGHLGHTRWLVPAGGEGALVWGESLGHWQKASRRTAVLWRLWQWVERGDSVRLSPFISWDRGPERAVFVRFVETDGEPSPELTRRVWRDSVRLRKLDARWTSAQDLLLASTERDPDLHARWEYGDVVGPMRYYICREVNKQLRGHVNMTVLPFVEDGVVRYFPDSLLSAIHVQFAHALVANRTRQAECQYPGCTTRVFVQRHRRQKYCSKQCRQNAGYHRHKDHSRVTAPSGA